MAKEIIHLYGASGSGNTTLGKLISQRFGYRFMDTEILKQETIRKQRSRKAVGTID